MRDFTYPSIYFANLLFAILFFGGIYFCFRSRKDGYWGKDSEEPKYRMMHCDDEETADGR